MACPSAVLLKHSVLLHSWEHINEHLTFNGYLKKKGKFNPLHFCVFVLVHRSPPPLIHLLYTPALMFFQMVSFITRAHYTFFLPDLMRHFCSLIYIKGAFVVTASEMRCRLTRSAEESFSQRLELCALQEDVSRCLTTRLFSCTFLHGKEEIPNPRRR